MRVANDVVRKRGLYADAEEWRCLYCGKTWDRRGKAAGFRKARGMDHVSMCWELLLWRAGYVISGYVGRGITQRFGAEPIATVERSPHVVRRLRLCASTWRKREREGLVPRVPS